MAALCSYVNLNRGLRLYGTGMQVMCLICPIVASTVLLGAVVVKSLKKLATPPESLPATVYGEDLED